MIDIESILSDVVVDPAAWSQILDRICEDFGIFGALVIPSENKVPALPMTGTMDQAMDSYFHGHWELRDERMKLAARLVRTGIAADQDLFGMDDMHRNAFWRDLLEPNRLRWWAGIRVMAGSELWCLSLHRTPIQGAFREEEQARLVRLSAPMSRAATLVKRLGAARLDGISDTLDLLDLPGFLIDRHGRIIRHNAPAEALLPGILSLNRGELKVTDRPDLSRALRQHLDATVRAGIDAGSRFRDGIAVPRDSGRSLFLQAHPLRRELASYFMPGCGLLLVSDPDLQNVPGRSMLRAIFELTEREVQLVHHLAEGRSLSSTASQMSIGYETARSYLKSVFMKTGAQGQSELMAIVARLGRAGRSGAGPD